ncbi:MULTISPECIES: division/cell wall cluster transcriptional repressor MraZ [unclassified Granulicatella]|uniref:division/cell wall cluster transcriptional repressor MraZ n=1 Tax=unclassified Granulicatella TaxID=2630493 RepID=UPI0010746274|nr:MULTISPECIES: division/cell wall cluster transcriptional repressor MraZ [unclassified Granulicatella]MBF0780153.1 division/cell wall cluster transcriptional repressor MraZ [Granulicatella sp. 19428wC4_WM01]TFU95757.1 division/cell wall cluster transcriptional repressor MraZ [Granulicatella sp. WM01]
MLMGEFKHTIDAKGRIIIPAKLREELGEEFILTRGLDGCLFGYPKDSWQSLTEKLTSQLPLGKKDARSVVRFFYSAASEVEFDKQGRIMIPATLREYAELSKNCRVIGVSDRLEIWDELKWQSYLADTQAQIPELTENISDFEF